MSCKITITVTNENKDRCFFVYTDNTDTPLVVASEIMDKLGIEVADCKAYEYSDGDYDY